MTEHYQPVADLLQRVRTRWRRLVLLRAIVRAALASALVLAGVLLVAQGLPRAPLALALVGGSGIVLTALALIWGLLPARDVPSDARLARFVEERTSGLDQRLVSAVDVATARGDEARPAFSASMLRDAARAVSAVDPADIVPAVALRRAGFQAAAAVLACGAVLFLGRGVARQAFDAASLALFPAHVVLEVTPGNARVEAGTTLRVDARLVGNQAPVVAQLLRSSDPASGSATEGTDDDWQAVEMETGTDGQFSLSLNALTLSFRYRVVAGAATSSTFTVAVVRAPRVARIDVEYAYPKGFGLAPRTEEDGGDIYAPAGTDVRLRVHTDTPAASGRMLLSDSTGLDLVADAGGRTMSASLKVTSDNSYRVTLADAEGLASRGETEYFIRTMDDRPPEIHVVKPASDRRVTPLEEVDIEAEAADDFGVSSLELVYSVRGKDTVVPLRVPSNQTTVSAEHTLFLEDLDVRPGDFVSYYVRARDLARGKPSSESRSDIFFLEIKNFEEEFTLAQSQAAMGGGASTPQLDELVQAQKDVIVATWKLDRRAKSAGATSAQDIRAVATAESDLRARVERMSGSFRQGVMRDPRARPPGGTPGGRGVQPGGQSGGAPQGTPRAGQALSEEDAMAAASAAMGEAVTELNALKTADAVTPEMEALNQLLRAQADVKKREVQRQQAGQGGGTNRATQDLSSLFDKELARRQETNYETRNSAAEREEQQATATDKIKELARRQDELLKQQQELARQRARMTPDEVKRELEKLTREQNDLRQRAEEIAQQLAQQNQSGQPSQSAQPNQQGQQSQSGQQSASNQPGGGQGQSGQAGQQGQSRPQQGQQQGQQAGQPQGTPSGQQAQQGRQAGQTGRGGQAGQAGESQGASGQPGENERRMREISEEMRASASQLRREDAEQASARSERALDKLRDLEQQLQSGSPEGRRRAIGDLQLEARQLADAERQVSADAQRAGQGEGGRDALRRLAGEQERLAERLRSVQEGLKQQGQAGQTGQARQAGRAGQAGQTGQGQEQGLEQAAAEASREIERQRLSERMQESAQAMRAQAGVPDANTAGANRGSTSAAGAPQAQEEIARALDRLADRLSGADRARDDESRTLTGQLARAQELRERLDDVTRRLGALSQQAGSQQGGQRPGSQGGRSSQPPTSQGTSGESGRSGQGQGAQGSTSAEAEQLRAEMTRELSALRELVEETRRDQGPQAGGGAGVTFEGRGMTLSAPGTEGFKQDFAKWQELKRQATAVLESIEASASKRLQEKESKDRLTAGTDDRAPAGYQQQVDSYFKALASRKTP